MLDAQFVKQENAGFIQLVEAKDVQKIADVVCSSYVQKESSMRIKLHVIRDLSGAFLFNAIRRLPGLGLEGICRQLVIFKSFVDNFISTTGQNCLIATNIIATIIIPFSIISIC